MTSKTKIKIRITHREVYRTENRTKHNRFIRKKKDWLKKPSEAEVYKIWKGLPIKEKITMILKQFFPGM